MAPVVDALASKYHVTNVGLPGSGHSDWNDNIKNIHDIADAILAVLPKEAIYVAWSFGGLVAQSIAIRYPERVKRFVGLGATPKFIASTNWIGFPEPGYLALVRPKVAEQGFKAFLRGYYEYEFSKVDPKADSYSLMQKICDHRVEIDSTVLCKLMEICDSTDLRKDFKSISCPIDLIIGNEDENVPKAAWQNIKTLNPNVKIHEINGAGHAPFWTHPEEFNKILNRILLRGNMNFLIGEWSFTNSILMDIYGQILEDPGSKGTGMLIYTASGNMAGQLSANRVESSKKEIEFKTDYIAYYGTYEFDSNSMQVTHHIVNSNIPVLVGASIKRQVKIIEPGLISLKLIEPETFITNQPVYRELFWRRISNTSSYQV